MPVGIDPRLVPQVLRAVFVLKWTPTQAADVLGLPRKGVYRIMARRLREYRTGRVLRGVPSRINASIAKGQHD